MKLEITKQAYKEVLDLVAKYKDVIAFNYNDLEEKSKYHLLAVELNEKYGFTIKPDEIRSLDYNRFNDYMSLGRWGEKYQRTVSWSDNGKQPVDELLLCIGFSTGAYIFGEDYPEDIFKAFWDELKTYNPKYIDTMNSNLYFSMENAGKIFNDLKDIKKKYHEKNATEWKERKIKKLQGEIDKLKV